MKLDFMRSWKENQDLNWGEMLEVSRVAEQAAQDKAREIRQRRAKLTETVNSQVAAWEESVKANPPKRVF